MAVTIFLLNFAYYFFIVYYLHWVYAHVWNIEITTSFSIFLSLITGEFNELCFFQIFKPFLDVTVNSPNINECEYHCSCGADSIFFFILFHKVWLSIRIPLTYLRVDRRDWFSVQVLEWQCTKIGSCSTVYLVWETLQELTDYRKKLNTKFGVQKRTEMRKSALTFRQKKKYGGIALV